MAASTGIIENRPKAMGPEFEDRAGVCAVWSTSSVVRVRPVVAVPKAGTKPSAAIPIPLQEVVPDSVDTPVAQRAAIFWTPSSRPQFGQDMSWSVI